MADAAGGEAVDGRRSLVREVAACSEYGASGLARGRATRPWRWRSTLRGEVGLVGRRQRRQWTVVAGANGQGRMSGELMKVELIQRRGLGRVGRQQGSDRNSMPRLQYGRSGHALDMPLVCSTECQSGLQ